jgi:DnaJ like chaperone protein
LLPEYGHLSNFARMSRFLQWIGGGVGWALGGPIGGLLGFALGRVFDKADESQGLENPMASSQTRPRDFEISLLVLSAVVIKADGKTTAEEMQFVRQYFARMYGAKHANESFRLFKEIVPQSISVNQVCSQIRSNRSHAARLQLLHFLFGIAKSDGQVTSDELETIEKISTYLYINHKDFVSIRSMFYSSTTHYYEVLEINPEASDDEVKKAYRRLAMKFHPDKLEGLGIEVKKGAQEKFILVQQAYEAICKERGIA